MKSSLILPCLLLLGTLGLHPLRAESGLGKAAENHIHAQQLVNQQMAKRENADLYILGLHAVAPGATEQSMIACNLDRIGKADTADDKSITTLHRTLVFQKLSEPGTLEVMLPIKDTAGAVIGMAVFVYHGFTSGADETSYYLRSVKMRDEMARATRSYTALFQPNP